MRSNLAGLTWIGLLALAAVSPAASGDDFDAQNLRIVKRAQAILKSPESWNRADSRVCGIQPCNLGCPTQATTFSLYCALKKATEEVKGSFDHRSWVLQESRAVIDEISPTRTRSPHRLEDFNNDPRRTLEDLQELLRLVGGRIEERISASKQ